MARWLDLLRTTAHPGLIALLLGAAMPFGLAPYDAWPVALLALGLFAELLQGRAPGVAARIGLCFGAGLWAHGASWLLVSMQDYGGTPLPLALAMLAFVAVVMGALFAPLTWLQARLGLGRLDWLTLPALLVLGEWLRTWLLTGFPWLMTGYGFIDTPLAGWAPLGGIYAVSLAAGITGVATLRLLRASRQAIAPVLVSALVWGGGYLLTQQRWTEIERDRPLSVSLVQGNIPQESKWALAWRDRTIKIYEDLTGNEWGRDLVIWPEAAIPTVASEAEVLLASLDNEGLKSGTAFVTGIPFATWSGNGDEIIYYNSIAALGEGLGLYHKQQLVPIGEYIPYEKWLRGTIPFFDLPMSSFSWGPREQPPLMIKGHRMAPFICYEIAYPALVQRLSKPADFLATISNDGWFGTSIGPEQHLEMVRMRALETGRYVVRGTNNGHTVVIDDQGRITARMPRFTRGVLRSVVYPARGLTPWQTFGEDPVLLLCVLLVLSGLLQARHQRRLAG